MAMNIEQARLNMVENQVRPWEVLDGRVLDVISRVRREDFVAAEHRQLAFADLCLPLGHGEVMMKPVVEGRVLQALELQPTDRVLEIGTGSGINAKSVAAEFLEHANEEQGHADQIAERITQLDGTPNFSPDGLSTRSHAEFVVPDDLAGMIEENLVAERIAIDSYREIINYVGDQDTTTKRMLEGILAMEEEHAEDMKTLMEDFGKKGEPAKPAAAGKSAGKRR
jgi:bacterioferritin (cytochrome b1)